MIAVSTGRFRRRGSEFTTLKHAHYRWRRPQNPWNLTGKKGGERSWDKNPCIHPHFVNLILIRKTNVQPYPPRSQTYNRHLCSIAECNWRYHAGVSACSPDRSPSSRSHEQTWTAQPSQTEAGCSKSFERGGVYKPTAQVWDWLVMSGLHTINPGYSPNKGLRGGRVTQHKWCGYMHLY